MKRLLILIVLLLVPMQVWGATLDVSVGLISDVHHSQTTSKLATLSTIQGIFTNEASITTYLGLGDIIDTNLGGAGPLSSNLSDLTTSFSGKNAYFVCGNHDNSGTGLSYADFFTAASALYPGSVFSQDIGTNWRIIGVAANDLPGYSVSAVDLALLETELADAVTDGKYVIVATHIPCSTNITPRTAVVTPSAVSGTVHITTPTAATFIAGDVGKYIFLRHTATWGYALVTVFNSGTDVTATVSSNFGDTIAADEWGFFFDETYAYNSSAVRTKLEAVGSGTVKLVLNGHGHVNATWTVNGIEYREVTSSTSSKNSGLLYLYTDGTWKIAGVLNQTSYNWATCFVSASGSDASNGGHLRYDPYLTLANGDLQCNVAGQTIQVMTGTYAGNWTVSMNAATVGSPITWNFEPGSLISGFSDATAVGDAWSAGVDGNGWYTKTTVTTEPKVLTEDGVVRSEAVYSASAVAGKWDWNANTLYYLPTSGAPSAHTVLIAQVANGINCQGTSSNCIYLNFNGAKVTGFNTAGLSVGASSLATFSDSECYGNGYGVLFSSGATFNRTYSHDNMNSGMYYNGNSGSANPTINCLLSVNNGKTSTLGDYCSGLIIWNTSYTPNVNNATLAYNYNGLRSYMQTGATNISTFSNIITYQNSNRGMNFNGTLNPSHTVQYSDTNDTQTWGNAVHTTGMMTGDPLFVSPAATGGNFRLLTGSPCKDSGIQTAATTDLDGHMVPSGVTFDIGAYEFFDPTGLIILDY